ncbi:LON peptidase substrate-binding domain-containing protein [Phaeobacter sp. QD34_3]|uniref:LON peptidase substrate-binding domain-containing protein n=1 Tax=unclassified Phaeobacter TaxID=2621772 RepID=UPI00237F2F78|nr:MULTISPECIES: LON peptidase substrate-binding domain-containing protein [unclassified Phaeobacter]MDE4132342.1 LON peptidase substrate-binding domain-containing protein [Phaeobacter sp. QD34_3]MDE4135980.1 LON peptidase substrate-binding domain-containing protein [Phaeobacter sp. QD34_24]MDE4173803.1 LON peptidase substrate-binding domain-containing protein [Phaeobacter sp. PT47_59]
MFNSADLPDVLPVFPLPGALLLPRSKLPLHIFEPRYLQMLEDTLKTPARLIGMVQPCPARDGGAEGLHSIGCAGRITQFSETEDGRYLITLSGVSRYRISEECTGFTPYRKCRVDWSGFDADLGRAEPDSGLERAALLELLSRYFAARNLSTDWDALQGADDELLINSLSMLLDFEPEDKQALLEAPCLATRRETLVTLIEFALRSGSHEDPLQ